MASTPNGEIGSNCTASLAGTGGSLIIELDQINYSLKWFARRQWEWISESSEKCAVARHWSGSAEWKACQFIVQNKLRRARGFRAGDHRLDAKKSSSHQSMIWLHMRGQERWKIPDWPRPPMTSSNVINLNPMLRRRKRGPGYQISLFATKVFVPKINVCGRDELQWDVHHCQCDRLR